MVTIKLSDLENYINQRKLELGLTGNDYVDRNNGQRRRPAKRALLQYIKDRCVEQGKKPPFDANF
jgi:hypothetical protein